MTGESSNLKATLSRFQLSNLDLARATGIDPSLISRYISGNRKLKKDSWQAEEIAEFLLMKADTSEKIEWLKDQFEASKLPVDIQSVLGMKRNLIQWISSDKGVPADDPAEPDEWEEAAEDEKNAEKQKGLVHGTLAIAAALSEGFRAMPQDESVDLFLTSDKLRIIIDPAFSDMIHGALADRKINANIVICVSGDTRHLNKIIQTYMGEMVSGTMRFYTFFGSTQNVAEQMFCIFRNRQVAIITETPVGSAHPIGIFVDDVDFVQEMSQSYDATYRYSQSMFNIYNDDYVRNMIEVLYCEYCIPGALCVVKDSINPMYMSLEAYWRVLRKDNQDEGEYAWKCNEYRRFHDSFVNMLENGMPNREIISLKRLKAIVSEGKCLMAGLYFLGTGFYELDLQGCRDILAGYVEYLNRFPNFSLRILDDLPELHSSNCWHVKENQSVAINDWNGDVPIMCHSGHSALIQEFQKHYETIWKRGTGSLGNRAYVISILQSIIREMDEKLDNGASPGQS